MYCLFIFSVLVRYETRPPSLLASVSAILLRCWCNDVAVSKTFLSRRFGNLSLKDQTLINHAGRDVITSQVLDHCPNPFLVLVAVDLDPYFIFLIERLLEGWKEGMRMGQATQPMIK